MKLFIGDRFRVEPTPIGIKIIQGNYIVEHIFKADYVPDPKLIKKYTGDNSFLAATYKATRKERYGCRSLEGEGYSIFSENYPAAQITILRYSPRSWLVTWEIDIEASSPRRAAEKALEIQRDPKSTATVFKLFDSKGNDIKIDLETEEDE